MIETFKLIQNEKLEISHKRKTNTRKQNGEQMNPRNNKTEVYSINFNEHVEENDFKIKIDHLDGKKKIEIDKLIKDYKTVFAKDKYDIGTVKDYETRIDLSVDKYCSKRPYSMPQWILSILIQNQVMRYDVLENVAGGFRQVLIAKMNRKDKTATGSAGRNVVFNLLKESQLLHKGYCLFIDNWYSSPTLYRKLYKMKTNHGLQKPELIAKREANATTVIDAQV
ncbi:hypothetical protein M0804_011841 [Polistes exclamans]|nr:hypothetical protein M0804_011841 [Polistes exclamans]